MGFDTYFGVCVSVDGVRKVDLVEFVANALYSNNRKVLSDAFAIRNVESSSQRLHLHVPSSPLVGDKRNP